MNLWPYPIQAHSMCKNREGLRILIMWSVLKLTSRCKDVFSFTATENLLRSGMAALYCNSHGFDNFVHPSTYMMIHSLHATNTNFGIILWIWAPITVHTCLLVCALQNLIDKMTEKLHDCTTSYQQQHMEYSKTSNNGPSEKWTASVQRTDHLPLTDFTIELIHFELLRSEHLSTPNNEHWWAPDNGRHTLANTKLPPKVDSDTTPTNSFVHSVNACWPLS